MILQALDDGAIAAVVLLFFSHIAPRFGAGNFILDVDEPHLFGKSITRREAHLVGALLHVLISMAFAGLYAYGVKFGLISDFGILPILGWSVVMTIFIGGVILPLEGHGIFGVKEDSWFPVDLLLTNVMWGILFWWLVTLWPISF